MICLDERIFQEDRMVASTSSYDDDGFQRRMARHDRPWPLPKNGRGAPLPHCVVTGHAVTAGAALRT